MLENHFGTGKSWKLGLKLKVLESLGKISLKVMHFSSGSNRKQGAIMYKYVYLNSEQLTSTFCFMLNFLQCTSL